MRYIRTDTNIWEVLGETRTIYSVRAKGNSHHIYNKSKRQTKVIKSGDTIEELCDELVIKYKNEEKPRCVNMTELMKSCDNIGVALRKHIKWLFDNYKDQLEICKLAIWTDKGLIYVAKMNKEGKLELL